MSSREVDNANRAMKKLFPGKVGVRERERRMAENYREAAAEFDEVQQALRESLEDKDRLRTRLDHLSSRAADIDQENACLRAANSRLGAIAWYGIPLALMLGVVAGWFF